MEKWAAYFSPMTPEEELVDIAQSEPAIWEAMEVEDVFTQDEISRRAYEKAEKFRRDQHAQISFAENKGRLQEKTELAQKLISLGVSIDIITEATGFSKDQLNAIQAKN